MTTARKKVLFDVLDGNHTARPAWVPFVGVHGAKLQGVTAKKYLQSAHHIVEGLTIANALYRPDGLPVIFDLQLEAEALGCKLRWAENTPPTVTEGPLYGSLDSIADLRFDTGIKRFETVGEATEKIKQRIGNEVAIYGLVTGPFTLASHLRGEQLLTDLSDYETQVHLLLSFCNDVARRTADFYISHGADVIAVVDPMLSLISPASFSEFLTPYLNKLFAHISARDVYSSLFVCGTATPNLENMVSTKCDYVSVDGNVPLPAIKFASSQRSKPYGGNLDLIALLKDTSDDTRRSALNCLEVGGNSFVFSPGCDIPYDANPDNIIAAVQMIYSDSARQAAKNLPAAPKLNDKVKLPDYNMPDTVTVDVVTLDSGACPPCNYTVRAVQSALAGLNFAVYNERKLVTRSGLAVANRLGFSNVPSLYVDGAFFASGEFNPDNLRSAVQAAYDRKNK